jgi:hypothetical protein
MQTITERTQELAVKTRLALSDVRDAAHSAAERVRDERGQISAEFMGLLFIVALVIGAIVALGVHTIISEAVRDFVNNIKSGDKPAGAPE